MRRRGVGFGCLGCGGGTLLVLALLGAAAWFLVIQPARSFLASWQGVPAQTQTQTGTGTSGTTITPPPSSGTATTVNTASPLTKADVQKFVRIRRDVRGALGSSFTGLQTVWTDVQNGATPNILQVVNILREVGGSVGAARTAQAAALAREGMTAERYAAVRNDVNRALGVPTVDFAQAAQALQQGRLPDLNTSVQTADPQAQALVNPFKTELLTTAAVGLLGL
ncbi:hypothetical protein [Deinococcus puniceus]|uniref:Uncharacterized protein n=1 Tax=Deinococcus puniceus TaxID=1182568 RepID=A0A172T806_9DEIO|nr:hypothetical protein [Deinococcus puniceus]ANE43076.1 hypothetical protein SU48_04055 [Deinococcus puniceus]